MWKSSCRICCTSMVVSFKDPLIVLQVSWSWKSLATLCAIEWFLFIVIPFMNCDVEKLLRLHWLLPSWILWLVLLGISILRSSCNTLCNWMAYLQCDSLHDSSPDVEKLLSYLVHFNGCFLHGSSDHLLSLLIMRSSCTLCTCMASLQCDSHELSPGVEKLLRLQWFLSLMDPLMIL